MSLACPTKSQLSDPLWSYAMSKIGEDSAMDLYAKNGNNLPSNSQVDSYWGSPEFTSKNQVTIDGLVNYISGHNL